MATPQPSTEALAQYQSMRDFAQTPEPRGEPAADTTEGSFVVQKHDARSLHYDFRLELDGTLKSWAVPKGPSLDPAVKRMAVQVEDHPVSYADFEGTIPPGHYGAGTVIVWDRGHWSPVGDARAGLRDGHLKFDLQGEKLHGRWALVRMKPRGGERQPTWLLIKDRDDEARALQDYDVLAEEPDSVLQPPPRKRRAAAKSAVKTAGVTHPERVIDKSSGVTKGELAAYYDSVADLMLPHLKDRPLALVRAPAGVDGVKFFQKHADENELPGMRLLDPSLDAPHEALLALGTVQGLHSAAQMNVVEIHTWNMTARAIQRPDRMVFDLDPGEGVQWPAMREAALLLRSFLADIGLDTLLKTSGGKGLHVVAPLAPKRDWQEVRAFAQVVVEHVAKVLPKRFAAKSGPRNRVGKIYIDYLRNGWGATTAAAWSARARPGVGVSVPVSWDELDMLTSGAHWTVQNVSDRLKVGNGPWGAMTASRQTLTKAMKALNYQPPGKDA